MDNTTKIPVTDADAEPTGDAVINSDGVMQDAPVVEATNTQPVAPESVMDVSAPPEVPVIEPASQPVETSEVTPEPAPVSESEIPAEVVSHDSKPADDTNIAPAVVTPTGADPVSTQTTKKSGKGMMIAIAVILALVLASAAVLFYLRSKDSKSSAKANTSGLNKSAGIQDASAATTVSTNDVDNSSKGVDTSLSSLDENKDFGADTLSDKSLGLQ